MATTPLSELNVIDLNILKGIQLDGSKQGGSPHLAHQIHMFHHLWTSTGGLWGGSDATHRYMISGGASHRNSRPAWLAAIWNALMHIINGNGPGNFARRIAQKQRTAADLKIAQLILHSLQISVEGNISEKLANDKKILNEVSRSINANDLTKAKKDLNSWLKTVSTKTAPPRERQQSRPRVMEKIPADMKVHEENIRLRDIMNIPVTTVTPKQGSEGIYLAKSDHEASELIQQFIGSDQKKPLYIAIATRVPGQQLKALAMIHDVTPSFFSLPVWKKLTNEGQEQEIPQIRDGFVWKIDTSDHQMALKTAPPKVEWTQGQYMNVVVTVAEFHDKAVFNKLHKTFQESEKAHALLTKTQDRKESKKLLELARSAKEEMRTCLVARIARMHGNADVGKSTAGTVSVNSVKLWEGDGPNKRVLKADVTMLDTTAAELRATSGTDGVFVSTCHYDEKGKARERQQECWIPLTPKPDGSPHTREEALHSLAQISGPVFGLQLNRDGYSFKLRVPIDKEEEGWQQVHDRKPPASKRYVIERVPASIPLQAMVHTLMETLHWAVESPRETRRGKGPNAMKTIFVKADQAPASENIMMDGKIINIRQEIQWAKPVTNTNPRRTDFFQGFSDKDAANTVLSGNAKDRSKSEAAKTYAYAVQLRTAEPQRSSSASARPVPSAWPAAAHAGPALAPRPLVPTAITAAVEESMAQRGAALQDFQKMMAQMQDMMAQCAAMMSHLPASSSSAPMVKKRKELAIPATDGTGDGSEMQDS